MVLFWQRGYLDTSIDDIVRITGVSRYGLYSTFGDKYELFVKAMDYYSRTTIQGLLGPMEGPDGGREEIIQYFDRLLAALDRPEDRLGCLIGNASVELVDAGAEVSRRIAAHFSRMRRAFVHALTNAMAKEEIPRLSEGGGPIPGKTIQASSDYTMDVEFLADYLVGVATGYLVCIRGGIPDDQVRRFIRTALAWLY